MTELRVWAPGHDGVDAVLEDGTRIALRRDGEDFAISDRRLADGALYRLSVDGGEPLPDPRSRHQPEGVHGPSRLVDLAAIPRRSEPFRPPPLRDAVIYELHIGTFTPQGTFESAIERLDHVAQLGANAIEIMPVAEFPGDRGWGYDGVDLFAPHHAYGGPAGLARLVDACHERGLALILDVVYNHLGPDGNVLPRFGPYFTETHHTPWGPAVNFDASGSDSVRAFVVENARMWLHDYGFDGLRLDAVHAIRDDSPVHVLEELACNVARWEREWGRRLWLIAEDDRRDPRLVRERGAGGYGLTAHWADDLHHAFHVALTGENAGYYGDFSGLADLATLLRRPYLFAWERSPSRGHRVGRDPAGLDGDRFVVCLQNHDQVGNRARGERITALADPRAVMAAVALLLTSPYVPLLFAGEEWGASTPFLYFTDHRDPALGRAVTRGRRREFAAFGWRPASVPDPQAEATFRSSVLRWEERDEGEHATLFRWYRDLIALRRSEPDLGCGDPRSSDVEVDPDAGWIRVRRGRHVVIANLGGSPARIPLPEMERGMGETRLASAEPAWEAGAVSLPERSALVWRAPAQG